MEPRSPLNSRRSRIRSTDLSLVPPTRLFKLAEEPNERQRKSYLGETRLMSPSPLVILPISPQAVHPSVQGVVNVKIVSETGIDEDDSMLEGTKSVLLNQSHQADFYLKLVKTSKKKLRLKFTIQCQYGGQNYQEVIISLPFVIITTKKNIIRRPELTNIHLKFGLGDRENEVWIKGKNFSARNTMEVTFGGRLANILETDENLIMCLAPVYPVEPGGERPVEVRVCNIDAREGKLEAEQRLIFTYCGPMMTFKEDPAPTFTPIVAPNLVPASTAPAPFQYAWNTEANGFFNQFRT